MSDCEEIAGTQAAKRISKRSSSRARSITKRWSNPEGYRVPVSPTVCSVNPGKELELRTALGVNRLKSYIWNPTRLPEAETLAAQLPISGSYFVQNRWRLKAGRLQPLGLHTDPELSSQACLGVVSVESPKKHHLRSLTAPLSRTTPKQGYHQWDNQDSKLPSNQRVCSAFPSANTRYSEPLSKVDPIVTSTDSEQNNSQRVNETENKYLTTVQGSRLRLPPLGCENESGVGIEHDTEKNEKDALSATSANTCNMDKIPTLLLNLELMHNRTLFLQHASTKRRIRRPSGNSGARLSHGWTNPQPLLPVTGRQPPTVSIPGPAKQETAKTQKKKEEENASVPHNPSVSVDVNKVLNRTESLELTES